MRSRRLGVLLALLASACHKAAPTAPGDGAPAPSAVLAAPVSTGTDAPAPRATDTGPLASPPAPPAPSAPAGEARRSTLTSLTQDPELRPQLAVLRAHFGPALGGPFAEQRIERAGGGAAVLVSRGDESDPVVLAVDRDQVLFTREHPVAGMTPPVTHLAIAPGPERGVAIFAWVAALHLVAARMWADDGNPFAEIVLFTPGACDALSAAYAPGRGWIVACAAPTGARAQLLREDLTVAWGEAGVIVGTVGPADRPRLAFDSPSSWTLSQRARAVGGDRTLSFRYGMDGEPAPP